MKEKGSLIVISGFSGAGKGTVAKELVKNYGYSLSISATTRKPRENEVHGVDYYFKTEDEFKMMIDYNGFIEYACYVNNYYGTPRKFVETELEKGHNVILEIEVQGALNIKRQYPDAILIFITAPSIAQLKQRLTGRGTEEASVIEKRMKRAGEEAQEITNYEYIVVNDDLKECVDRIHGIVLTKKCELAQNIEFVEQLKQDLK